MEMFFLSYVNETLYLISNLPFFKLVPPKTKFWLINSSTNQYSYQWFHGWGITHLMASYLKHAHGGRGVWGNSLSLDVSLLSDSQLSD